MATVQRIYRNFLFHRVASGLKFSRGQNSVVDVYVFHRFLRFFFCDNLHFSIFGPNADYRRAIILFSLYLIIPHSTLSISDRTQFCYVIITIGTCNPHFESNPSRPLSFTLLHPVLRPVPFVWPTGGAQNVSKSGTAHNTERQGHHHGLGHYGPRNCTFWWAMATNAFCHRAFRAMYSSR